MSYKRTTKSLAEIGRELHAAYLVESSLREEGGRFRITSKLIRVRDQLQIWSAVYDSEPSSMLAFSASWNTAVAEQDAPSVSPERLRALAKRQTAKPGGLRPLFARTSFVESADGAYHATRGLNNFLRATALDPKYPCQRGRGWRTPIPQAQSHADAAPFCCGQRLGRRAARRSTPNPGLARSRPP